MHSEERGEGDGCVNMRTPLRGGNTCVRCDTLARAALHAAAHAALRGCVNHARFAHI